LDGAGAVVLDIRSLYGDARVQINSLVLHLPIERRDDGNFVYGRCGKYDGIVDAHREVGRVILHIDRVVFPGIANLSLYFFLKFLGIPSPDEWVGEGKRGRRVIGKWRNDCGVGFLGNNEYPHKGQNKSGEYGK